MALFRNKSNQKLSFSIPEGDFIVHPGSEVELPAQNQYIKALVGKGYLSVVEVKTKKVSPKKSIKS